MKKLLLIITLLIGVNGFSQGTLDLQVTQDAKLLLLGDEHGNSALTPNIRFDVMLNGGINGDENVYWFLGTTIEYADLHGGKFLRWGLISGVAFKSSIFNIDTKIEPYIGIAKLDREDATGFEYSRGLSLETGVNWVIDLTDRFSLVAKPNLMQRTDLAKYNDNSASFRVWQWKPNFGIGCRYSF